MTSDEPQDREQPEPFDVPDEQLPDDLRPDDDNPLAEGLPPGESADLEGGKLAAEMDPPEEDADGAEEASAG